MLDRLTTCGLAALLALFVSATGGAQERWPDQRRVGPFVVYADFPLDDHGELLAELAPLQRDVAHTLGIAEPRELVHLFLFSRQATYKDYLRQHFADVPYRRALFVKQRGVGMVFAHLHRDVATDVRHESTHALLHAALPAVPLWLDEGLAEYFEVPADKRAADNPHLKSMGWHFRLLGRTPEIEGLEGISDLNDMKSTEYRNAWAWVHYMLHGPAEAREELINYLADLQAGQPAGVLSRRLQHRLPRLERSFAEHFRRFR